MLLGWHCHPAAGRSQVRVPDPEALTVWSLLVPADVSVASLQVLQLPPYTPKKHCALYFPFAVCNIKVMVRQITIVIGKCKAHGSF